MNMKKLMIFLFIVILGFVSGVVLVVDIGVQFNNGQVNFFVDVGQVVLDVCENVVLNNVDNSQINFGFGGIMGLMMIQDNMLSDEVYKNLMCKDGCCLDIGKKLDNGGNMI